MVRLSIIAAFFAASVLAQIQPDPNGQQNIGNGRGAQFINGACTSSRDCQTQCCAFNGNFGGVCSGTGAQFQDGKGGCGFGDGGQQNGNRPPNQNPNNPNRPPNQPNNPNRPPNQQFPPGNCQPGFPCQQPGFPQQPGQPFPPGNCQPGFPCQQPFPGQPVPGQPFPGQPFPGQPFPGNCQPGFPCQQPFPPGNCQPGFPCCQPGFPCQFPPGYIYCPPGFLCYPPYPPGNCLPGFPCQQFPGNCQPGFPCQPGQFPYPCRKRDRGCKKRRKNKGQLLPGLPYKLLDAGAVDQEGPGAANVGTGNGQQGELGQCFADNDCQSGCCSKPDGACVAREAAEDDNGPGCGFTAQTALSVDQRIMEANTEAQAVEQAEAAELAQQQPVAGAPAPAPEGAPPPAGRRRTVKKRIIVRDLS
ncbi:hypothetical protein B0T11DRAFT_118748 [Plectosphaerella cucumerina]|uniref:Uncharacterized protein n=1 Tax=Plectosphaerella cucumerina TaxID=40658 RepID=A0A8K0TAT6_9PEZI|nr:hypothetical protein B0T11DRAFT_118748 [Plectosphaerella cucumerina]